MVIRNDEIQELFNLLCKNEIDRKDAQQWAVERRIAFDNDNLKFHPIKEEDKIWEALEFIELYAIMLDVENYLYSECDLLEYVKFNNWGGIP